MLHANEVVNTLSLATPAGQVSSEHVHQEHSPGPEVLLSGPSMLDLEFVVIGVPITNQLSMPH